MKLATGFFMDRLWQFSSLNCHLTYWKPVAVHIFSSEYYCVLSGEGSVLNGKSSLCELIIMQKSSPLKGTLFFLLSFNLLLLEFIFYRGKIDRLRRIFFKR